MQDWAKLSRRLWRHLRPALLFIALSCGRAEPASMSAAVAPEAPPMAQAEPGFAPAPSPSPPSSIGAGPGAGIPIPASTAPVTPPADATASAQNERAPLLIYSATLTLAVFGAEEALDAVEQLARERRGYLVRRSDTSITIRVPAAAFDETLAGVSQLGDELHREVSAQDVTEEYSDLQIRLRNAEVMRQRLEALLEKALKVEDALAVERELERVTQSIEQLKGKLRLLEELLAFSTITVNFQPRATETVSAEVPLPFDWLHQLGLSNLLSL